MYYVIQRYHNDHQKHYFAYVVAKYIAAKNTQNVIFEITQNGVTKRKWSPKKDIILLTADKELFRSTIERLEAIKEQHLEKINSAQEKLNQELSQLYDALQKEFETILLSSQAKVLT
jgi:predicted transcriptional regulator